MSPKISRAQERMTKILEVVRFRYEGVCPAFQALIHLFGIVVSADNDNRRGMRERMVRTAYSAVQYSSTLSIKAP
jgi:hypothetical protein